jgi:hypothetical protein
LRQNPGLIGSKAVAILRQGGHEVVAGSLPDYQKIDMHPRQPDICHTCL